MGDLYLLDDQKERASAFQEFLLLPTGQWLNAAVRVLNAFSI